MTWRPLDRKRAGLLARGRDDSLYLVDGRGDVHRSADNGRTWRVVGATNGQPAAFASEGSELYVALHTNEVKLSSDGGRTWRTRVAP